MPVSEPELPAVLESAPAEVRKYEHLKSQPENPFSKLISGQKIALIPSFTLESGVTLTNVPVAYKTSGCLNEARNNVMVICHALTGSADVWDWWGPLIGPGRAFDTGRFFVVCCNSLGSPYGSASPCTTDPETGRIYGPEFPLTTVRDDVNIHKLILDYLGVKEIAVVIGGSMGGMLVLEWAYFGKDYVKSIVPIATSSRHSAWCISWGEAQRQSIYSDPKYEDGYYPFEDPPVAGLGAARMSALLTYRTRNSFESRFGRNTPDPSRNPQPNSPGNQTPSTPGEGHWAIHNEGFKNARRLPSRSSSISSIPALDNLGHTGAGTQLDTKVDEEGVSSVLPPGLPPVSTPRSSISNGRKKCPTYFSAQSYLRYQGDKFVKRFDANCYIAITRKLDTHDISRGRVDDGDVRAALRLIEQPALVIGIESDGLFTYAEQQELAKFIPNARLATIDSPEGHDAFLLQFEEVNRHILGFLKETLPEFMDRPPINVEAAEETDGIGEVKAGTVGEVDDITAW
ncbi:homoserine O-acetyltransferase [Morchella conica CCBAS932]|uniref:Homoserine O-acetyltransferase n=1 Tax=Morchella conica CCBAS932 TaxID=1392247 RepID=A0A3N4KQU1_9PEZI|nr:homoserine O-acetyltransferase [Morchella conica CCBAS932]